MSTDLGGLIEQYRVALEAELVLLGQLKELAGRQRATTAAADIDALQRASDQRDTLMSGLLAIEQQVRAVRDQLSKQRSAARRMPGFDHVVGLHETVARTVRGILDTDRDSIRALEQIVESRRVAARSLDQAESTLAAYGRMVMPPPSATLVNRKG